mgnify:FL=1
MTEQNEKHPLMTVPEVADALRLSRNTINNWLSQQRLKRVKLGRRTFVSRAEVDSLLAKALKS